MYSTSNHALPMLKDVDEKDRLDREVGLMYRDERVRSDGGVLKVLKIKLFRRGRAMMRFDEGHFRG